MSRKIRWWLDSDREGKKWNSGRYAAYFATDYAEGSRLDVAERYIHAKEGEQMALTEQLERLPSDIARKIAELTGAYEERSSLEGR